MTTWRQLFVRFGFTVKEEETDVFCWEKERSENTAFAMETLNRMKLKYVWNGTRVKMFQPPVSESAWVEALQVPGRGVAEMVSGEPTLKQMDTYISGLVVQLNRLGLQTTFSCDGHGRRPAQLGFIDKRTTEEAARLLKVAFGRRVRVTNAGIRINVPLASLLDCAEAMSTMESVMEEKKLRSFHEKTRRERFEEKLEALLMIPGRSGEEGRVREFVKQEITPFVDDMVVDDYGNLLARKVCGTGRGPVLLLNAHLDTIEEIAQGRTIVKKGNEWTSSIGILSADDRAGVAVILDVLQKAGTRFNGTLKLAFTVEEERGLQGARHVNPIFLWGVDAAVVLDRRGSGDIVVRGAGEDFCSARFASRVKHIAGKGWSCVPGGSSDARVWAGVGIETVNLSVGYRGEHTEEETLDIDACLHTAEIVLRMLENSQTFVSPGQRTRV